IVFLLLSEAKANLVCKSALILYCSLNSLGVNFISLNLQHLLALVN
ncbi:hypothetical protein CP02DC21_1388, partial [Chlamydia psittaci 02DC21]